MKVEVFLHLSRQQIKLIFLDNFNLGGKDKIKYFITDIKHAFFQSYFILFLANRHV